MTVKQKLVASKLIENGGNISKTMEQVGYSKATARNPQKLTNSKGWQELLDKFLPDDKLLKKHDEALEATKWNDFTGEKEPDHSIRLKGIELGYKIKRRIGESNVNINEAKILVMPAELITKYDLPSDSGDSSK